MALVPDASRRGIKEEEYLAMLALLVKQAGGSVVFDAADFTSISKDNILIETKLDPWQLILKVVPE